MKYWGFVVVLLYLLILFTLLIPLEACILPIADQAAGLKELLIKSMKSVFFPEDNGWAVWVYFAVLLLAQAAFLSIPVEMGHKRPATKRTVIPLVIAVSRFPQSVAGLSQK